MLETRTRLKGAIPAWRRAISKLTSFSLCAPRPRTRKTLVGTRGGIFTPALLLDRLLLVPDRLRLLEVDVARDVVDAEQDRRRTLGDGEEPDLGLLPLRVVADAGQVLAVDAEVALQDDEVACRAGRDRLAPDGGHEGVAEVLRVALEVEDGVEIDVSQRLGA